MRFVLLALLLLCGVASADTYNVQARRVFIGSAQADADEMARTGILRHCGRSGGRREGIGFSTAGPDEACASACFWKEAMRGRYRIVEKGVAWSPVRRGWFACIRYE